MEDKLVTVEVCELHRKLTNEKLTKIESDTSETRAGIGKLIRLVTESNGQPCLVEQVRKNNEFRTDMEAIGIVDIVRTNQEFRQEFLANRDERRKRQWSMFLAISAWVVTIGLWIMERFFPVAGHIAGGG